MVHLYRGNATQQSRTNSDTYILEVSMRCGAEQKKTF